MSTPAADAERGRQAAAILLKKGVADTAIDDPLTPAFARGALEELERYFDELDGTVREALQGAERSAEQLNADPFRGLIEVLQNADDLGATALRVAIRPAQRELLIVHDGDRVRLQNVIAMGFAFVTTKRADPRAKGRFGIGLKTLGRLATELQVHCSPYHFAIGEGRVRRLSSNGAVAGFFDPRSGATLLVLELRERFRREQFTSWLDRLGSKALLFLDSVRSVKLMDLSRKKTLSTFRLAAVDEARITLPPDGFPCNRTVYRDPASGQRWARYEGDKPLRKDLRGRYKVKADPSPLGIVIPEEGGAGTMKIYAGLPICPARGLPLGLHAQFDPDLARQALLEGRLNEWLLGRLAELAAGAALHRFLEEPAQAWHGVPLRSDREPGENDEPLEDDWLEGRLRDFVDRVQRRVRRGFRITLNGEQYKLSDLCYECQELDGLLDQRDVDLLGFGQVLVPKRARDRAGRWRRVLSELAASLELGVENALELLDRSDGELKGHSVRWFIRLARAAIDAGHGETLWSRRSVITAEGERIVPPMPNCEGELLLRRAQRRSLAWRIGIAHQIAPEYLGRSADATVVREWLSENDMLHEDAASRTTLEALAHHGESNDPIFVPDELLRSIRDAFGDLDQEAQDALGRQVGAAILVDVQHWRGGKRSLGRARPAEAYLPASIDDRAHAWSKAAAKTPGLYWVHPRYQEVLRLRARNKGHGAQGRRLAARAFFKLLGVEVAPRLVEPDEQAEGASQDTTSIDPRRLSRSQHEALSALRGEAMHLKGDRCSPDLVAVLHEIRRERGLRSRRARASALFATLDREWQRLYAEHTEAEAGRSYYRRWKPAGRIPSTWLAEARDKPWLTSQNGRRVAPRELVVPTPTTVALYGDDKSRLAAEVSEAQWDSPLVRALGMATDPQVSELIDELTALREGDEAPDAKAVLILYACIAKACKKSPSPDDRVGDVSVRQLRSRFAGGRGRKGLVYANGDWHTPRNVFLGRPIFGTRRPFVSEQTAARRLWEVLGIRRPALSDCVEVIKELSRAPLDPAGHQILLNVYRYMEERLTVASRREVGRVSSMPVWTGKEWRARRPIYALWAPELEEPLSRHLAVWRLPVAASSIPKLLAAARVTQLRDWSFEPIYDAGALAVGEVHREEFARAVSLLRDWLARHDAALYEGLEVAWDELCDARIAIAHDLRLRLVERPRVTVAAPSHVSRDPLTLYFRDAEQVGESHIGGAAIATLFGKEDRDKVALAWAEAWREAERGSTGRVSLVEDRAKPNDQTLGALLQETSRPAPLRPRRRGKRGGHLDAQAGRDGSGADSPRKLKPATAFSAGTTERIAGSGIGSRPSARRPVLREGEIRGRPLRVPESAPANPLRAYSDQDREDLAVHVLRAAIEKAPGTLRDCRHIRRAGADLVDDKGRFFEIKAHGGELPSQVSLTASETERAVRKGERFILVVIAGLEEGYETVVRLIPDPLRKLRLRASTKITLTDIRKVDGATEIRFPANAGSGPVSPENGLT